MIFWRPRDQISSNDDLVINNVKIETTEQTKFLGVIIDQTLTFQRHINYIKGNMARGIDILCKVKSYFNSEKLRAS